jgi:hypothetical protein
MNRAVLLAVAAGMLIAQTGNFAGRYYLQNLREVGSELLLRPNRTFEFELAYGAVDYSAKGTWRAQGGTVILNSAAGKDAPPFKLVSSTANPEPAIIVRVQGPNGRGIPNIDVVLGTDTALSKSVPILRAMLNSPRPTRPRPRLSASASTSSKPNP